MEGQELPGCAAATTAAAAAAVAAWLLHQALALEEVQARAAAVGALVWESPAGWNFRDYLADRSRALGSSADLIRRAARLADLHAAGIDTAGALAAELQTAELETAELGTPGLPTAERRPGTETGPAAGEGWDRW